MATCCAPACSQALLVKPQGVWARGSEAWAGSRDLRNLEFVRWGSSGAPPSSGPSSLMRSPVKLMAPRRLRQAHEPWTTKNSRPKQKYHQRKPITIKLNEQKILYKLSQQHGDNMSCSKIRGLIYSDAVKLGEIYRYFYPPIKLWSITNIVADAHAI